MSVSTEAINKLATIGIYRQLIKKLLDYPSINRLEVYLETKRRSYLFI